MLAEVLVKLVREGLVDTAATDAGGMKGMSVGVAVLRMVLAFPGEEGRWTGHSIGSAYLRDCQL